MAQISKPKLKIDSNSGNVKLNVKQLNAISKWLIDEYKIIFYNGDMWYIKNGIYIVSNESQFKSWIKDDFDDLIPKQIDIVIANCLNYLDYDSQYNLDKYKNNVYFTNGIYHLDTSKFEYLDADERGFSPNIIPYDFKLIPHDKLKLPKFKNLTKLINIFGQFDNELINYFLEIMGSAMSMRTPFANLVIFYGDGNNAKSTLFTFLSKVIGSDNTDRFSLKSLTGDKYEQAIMPFYGNTFVYDPDATKVTIKDMSDLKQLTGGDMVYGRKVYGKGRTFQNVSTILIAANKIPKIPESSKAIDRRLALYPFAYDIDDLPIDKKLTLKEIDEIMSDVEIHQLFAGIALNAFSKAIKNQKLTMPEKMKTILDNFKIDNNNIYRWLVEEGEINTIKKQGEYNPETLFLEFGNWASKEKIKEEYARKGFTQALNTCLKKEFNLNIKTTQKRENGKVVRKYNIINSEANLPS